MLSTLRRAVRPGSGLRLPGSGRFAVRCISVPAQKLNAPVADVDPEMASIISREKERQVKCVNLIPSENFTSQAVLDALGSVMQNKYSEGYPGARYYGGNELIDESELLCQKRALEAYGLDPAEWGVNVQVYSGAPANFAVFTALVPTHGRIMGLDLPHGGHLSHGFQTDTKKVSMVSHFWETLPYRLDESTGLINYEEMEFLAKRFRPKVLISGATAYSRIVDVERFRAAADAIGNDCVLLYDMAHISGLVAAGVLPSPFEFADVVTTTTHKSLRGPRGSMIFYRKGQKKNLLTGELIVKKKSGEAVVYDYEKRINETVFPGMQGGPHNHSISALAIALKQATTPEFKEYNAQIIKNTAALCSKLQQLGYDIVSNGTDNHMALIDLTKEGVSGAKGERICELVNIVCNKNTVPKDKSAMNPSGLRVGAPAMTSRGFLESDFEQVAAFIDRAIKLANRVQQEQGAGVKKLVDFTRFLKESNVAELDLLKQEVEAFASGFEMIG